MTTDLIPRSISREQYVETVEVMAEELADHVEVDKRAIFKQEFRKLAQEAVTEVTK